VLHILLDSSQPAVPMEFSWGNIGAAGVCIAMLAYVVKVTIPQIMANFREDLNKQQTVFSTALDKQQNLFTEELAKERELARQRESNWRETLMTIMRDFTHANQMQNLSTAVGQNLSATT